MAPEFAAAFAAVIAAAITAGPAYMAARRTGRTVETEGAATRECVARVEGRVDELREGVADIRAWQAGHAAEHMLIERGRRG